MPKIVAMIPARLGSKRVKNKNLRLLGGKPLIAHVLEIAKASGVFDEIYINSESEVFAEIAGDYSVQFYKRAMALAQDDATNDEFMYDFLKNVDCDIVIQINPTSPLYAVDDITGFVTAMCEKEFETMHGVRKAQIEAIFKGKALNFDQFKRMPKSQDLEPLLLHAGGLMGWRKESYIRVFEQFNCGTYGCASRIGYYPLYGLSQIDIDTEEDFAMAEIALEYRDSGKTFKKQYYKEIESLLQSEG